MKTKTHSGQCNYLTETALLHQKTGRCGKAHPNSASELRTFKTNKKGR